MHYIITLLSIAVVCFALGYASRAFTRWAKPWHMAIVGGLLGAAVMWFVNDAYAVPADIETATAYNLGNDPTYRQIDAHARPCSHLTFGEALRGEIRPLPVACVLPLPLDEATVSKPKPSADYHYVKPSPMFKGLP